MEITTQSTDVDRCRCEDLLSIYESKVKNSCSKEQNDENMLIFNMASLLFNSNSSGEINSKLPFKPYFNLEGRCSISLNDFDQNSLMAICSIFDKITNPDLKARASEILLFSSESREKVMYGEYAVRNYLEAVENIDIGLGYSDIYFRLLRCSQIIKQFRAAFDARLLKMVKNYICSKIKSCDLSFCQTVSELYSKLNWLRMCLLPGVFDKVELETYGKLLLDICEKLNKTNGQKAAIEGYKLGICFFCDGSDKVNVCHLNIALISEYLGNIASDYANKAKYYEEAVIAYRNISSKKYGSEINRLESVLSEVRKKHWGFTNFSRVRIESDMTNLASKFKSETEDMSLIDRVKYFAALREPYSREQALDMVDKTKGSLHGLIKVELLDYDCKRLNKSKVSQDYLSAEDSMQFNYCLTADISIVELAISIILVGQQLTRDDLNFIFSNNVWIPDKHKTQIERGVVAGFNNDFMTFSLFIVPVFESMLRSFLEEHGINTFKQNKDGKQEDYSLKELFARGEVREVLGKKLSFELSYLLVEDNGSLIRPHATHGKFNDSDYQAYGAIKLFFWVIIRLLVGGVRQGSGLIF